MLLLFRVHDRNVECYSEGKKKGESDRLSIYIFAKHIKHAKKLVTQAVGRIA